MNMFTLVTCLDDSDDDDDDDDSNPSLSSHQAGGPTRDGSDKIPNIHAHHSYSDNINNNNNIPCVGG